MMLEDCVLKPAGPPGASKVGADLESERGAQTGRRYGEGTAGRGSTRHERMGGLISRTPRDIRLNRLRAIQKRKRSKQAPQRALDYVLGAQIMGSNRSQKPSAAHWPPDFYSRYSLMLGKHSDPSLPRLWRLSYLHLHSH